MSGYSHKFLSIFVMLLLLVAGTGCASDSAPPATPENTPANTTPEHHDADDPHAHDKDDLHAHDKDDPHAHDKDDPHAHDKDDPHAHDKDDPHAHDAEQSQADPTSLDDIIAALTPSETGEPLTVIATTNIVGDVVGQVGGEHINLITLIPVGADPHTFEPTPREISMITGADVVFTNGMNLEENLLRIIEHSGIAHERIIPVSVGISPIAFNEEMANADHHDDDHGHNHDGLDPHTWMSPRNVMIWTSNIAKILSALDPANASAYTENADRYTDDLEALDQWIDKQIAQIPSDRRLLVTDHTAFGYYTHEYGLTQIGAVIPAYSTAAEPSAQELAALQRTIAETQVPAIFVGTTVNPSVAQQIANDMNIQLLTVYTGSLSDVDGDAPSYLAMMRYNTEQIVNGLRNESE